MGILKKSKSLHMGAMIKESLKDAGFSLILFQSYRHSFHSDFATISWINQKWEQRGYHYFIS